jgi:hypothetical protein
MRQRAPYVYARRGAMQINWRLVIVIAFVLLMLASYIIWPRDPSNWTPHLPGRGGLGMH